MEQYHFPVIPHHMIALCVLLGVMHTHLLVDFYTIQIVCLFT